MTPSSRPSRNWPHDDRTLPGRRTPRGWVTGGEVYGGHPKLRTSLEERGIGYVLAVACSAEVLTPAGKFRAEHLVKRLPKRAWQKLSAGHGAKGNRFYDWAVIDLAGPRPARHQLLIRRNRSTGELAYYRCFSPRPVPLTELVRVAGSRWRVEEAFQTENGLAGLDEHQVRRYPSWTRWVTLAMLAHAFLAVVRADEHAGNPAPDGLVPLSCNEIQHLFTSSFGRPTTQPTGSAGPTGDAVTKPGPAPAITDDKPQPRHEDHDLQLEYQEAVSPDRSDVPRKHLTRVPV